MSLLKKIRLVREALLEVCEPAIYFFSRIFLGAPQTTFTKSGIYWRPYRDLAKRDLPGRKNQPSPAEQMFSAAKLAATLPFHCQIELMNLLKHSESQFGQDLFALSVNDFKHSGYFVEVGVGDGRFLSNTYLLEDQCGWRGVLVEPQRGVHEKIRACRTAHLCTDGAGGHNEMVGFFENHDDPEKSLSGRYGDNDVSYTVKIRPLADILESSGAPSNIDYISLDIEGGELEVLKVFPFDRFFVSVWTIEHNHNSAKSEAIKEIMCREGYDLVHPDLSGVDHWFVRSTA